MIILYLSFSYLLGSIPFGFLLTKIKKIDIREVGSGNIGATNVLRTGNRFLAFLTFFLDGAKGALVVIIGKKYFNHHFEYIYIAAFLTIIGHMYPCWLRFKGGKGVATYALILIAFDKILGISFCASWLFIFYCTKISSLSSIVASLIIPIVSLLLYFDLNISAFYLLLSSLVILKHYGNITRIFKGEELAFKK